MGWWCDDKTCTPFKLDVSFKQPLAAEATKDQTQTSLFPA